MRTALNPGERLDDLGNGLKIIQHQGYFAFSTDAVLLSEFVSLFQGDKVADLGTGTGVIPLLLSRRRPLQSVIALELQAALVELCRRSVALNGLDELIKVMTGDIRNVRELFAPESFDVVTANPPYIPITGSQVSKLGPVAIARHELCCSLESVIQAFAWLVRFGGKVAMVHRPPRLAEIMELLCSHKLEPKRMQLVHPRQDKDAELVLIEAEKGARRGLHVLPPRVLTGGD